MKDTPDPQLRKQLQAYDKKFDEVFDQNDAAAMAALYTEDAVMVTDTGLIYGRKALEKHFADKFQQGHYSKHLNVSDQGSPRTIGTAGTEVWETGEWSLTYQDKGGDPVPLNGYWSAIKVREGDTWKTRMETWNITPAPAATGAAPASPTTTPNNK